MPVLTPLETLVVVVAVMVANGSPVLLAGGTPLDMGRRWRDGRRILGDGKTFQGYLLGVLYGTSVGIFLSGLVLGPENHTFLLPPVLVAVNGGLLGDIVAAFLKRRAGLERGAKAPLLDQLDFYAGSLIALYFAGYTCDPGVLVVMAIVILFLHRATNIAAYLLGLKDVPW